MKYVGDIDLPLIFTNGFRGNKEGIMNSVDYTDTWGVTR